MAKRCYVTGKECSCGGFDVAADCPFDEAVHGEEEEDDDDFSTFGCVERRFSEMEDQLGDRYASRTST